MITCVLIDDLVNQLERVISDNAAPKYHRRNHL